MQREPKWLDEREDRAWRAFMHAHHRLGVRINQLLLQDFGLTKSGYELLAGHTGSGAIRPATYVP